MKLFSKVAYSEARQTGTKQNLTQGHAFVMPEKLSTECLSLYNNAGPIFKLSEEIANENVENCHCQQLHCHKPYIARN